MLRETDLAQRAGEAEAVEEPEGEGDEPGQPVRERWLLGGRRTISPATKTMLSAIAASTGLRQSLIDSRGWPPASVMCAPR